MKKPQKQIPPAIAAPLAILALVLFLNIPFAIWHGVAAIGAILELF